MLAAAYSVSEQSVPMRIGSSPEYRGVGAAVFGLASAALVAALALVAPTNGLCNPKLHELVLVHPIFSHYHEQDPHAAHRDPDAPLVAKPASPGSLAVSPVGPLGAGLGIAYEGMLAASPLTLLLVAITFSMLSQQHQRVSQAFLAVPTGPPRLAPS